MPDQPTDGAGLSRREALQALAGAATAGSVLLAGCSLAGDAPAPTGTTVPLDEDRARSLAERFAPMWYFDAHERWFPTDPRPYEGERDGEPVVDGFAALDGYTRRFREGGAPPDPTLFYRAVRYEGSSLGVVQWWAYSAFDQFTTNFHWHDWEVLFAFVDLDTGEPELYVASAHARSVPNNEFLDPDPDGVPHVLSELGSHSSALSVNEEPETFQRLPGPGLGADVTNAALGALETLADVPAAYGLPRDEGFRLPFVVPELDDRPIYEHPDLPAVDREALLPEALTVRGFADLATPPADLPTRETGLVFGPEGRDADVAYKLVPTAEIEHLTAFTGPQLSFEFALPGFVEDRLASHITTSGVPWEQPRYDDPASDVTDPDHRRALTDRYPTLDAPDDGTLLAASIRQAREAADAPDGEGLETTAPTVEAVALVESEPSALPTFNGAVVARGLPEGDHQLTVNAAGVAPHSESVSVGADAATVAGVDGAVPLVANEQAVKLAVDPGGTDADLTRLAVEDDFAGRLYDAPLSGPDAVYVHRGGAFTTEVEDADADLGAFRVNPAAEDRVAIDRPDTGKAVLATYVADIVGESRGAVEERVTGRSNAVNGLVTALESVASAARRAAERAQAGDRGQADEALGRVHERLDTLADRLAAAREDLPAPLGNALERRFAQADRRTEQALDAGKL